MPLKVSVGLTKKVGQPDYGSLGASCHVEYEADGALLLADPDSFQRQVKNAFMACRQAVQDELHRHQQTETGSQPGQYAGNGRPANGTSGHASANGNGRGNSRQQGTSRKATASQVRAIGAIANRLQLDLANWLEQHFGLRTPGELSIADASHAIDELKALPSGNGSARGHQ